MTTTTTTTTNVSSSNNDNNDNDNNSLNNHKSENDELMENGINVRGVTKGFISEMDLSNLVGNVSLC